MNNVQTLHDFHFHFHIFPTMKASKNLVLLFSSLPFSHPSMFADMAFAESRIG